jgi:hypothetical protein
LFIVEVESLLKFVFGDHIQSVGENTVAKMVQSCKHVAPLCIVVLKIKDDMLPKIPMFANLSSCGLHGTTFHEGLKWLIVSHKGSIHEGEEKAVYF